MNLEENFLENLILDHSLCGTLVLGPDLKILAANTRAKELCLTDPTKNWLGQSFISFIGTQGDRPSLSAEQLKMASYFGEILLQTDADRIFPAQISVRSIETKQHQLHLLSFQDISIQKKIQRDLLTKQEGLREILEELTLKNEELLTLDAAKNKFLALVAHELRTPLNGILATSEILFEKIYTTPQEQDMLIQTLNSQCSHLRILVNDILDLTKIQSGKMDLYIEQLDLTQIYREAINEFTEMASSSQVRLQIDTQTNTALLAYFDPLRMKQIAANLISNAIKFNRPNGTVTISFHQQPDTLEIRIQDTGIGIPSDRLHSIFNQFETIENISHHHKGTGLGLPIVKSLIEAQGGTIQVDSNYGQGSTFRLRIPLLPILTEEVYRSRTSEQDGFILFDDEEEVTKVEDKT